jgi:hypothetical protein
MYNKAGAILTGRDLLVGLQINDKLGYLVERVL